MAMDASVQLDGWDTAEMTADSHVGTSYADFNNDPQANTFKDARMLRGLLDHDS
jgi:hypothetical protein